MLPYDIIDKYDTVIVWHNIYHITMIYYMVTLPYHIIMTYGSFMLPYDKNGKYGNVTI